MYTMEVSNDGSKVAACGFDMSKGYSNDVLQVSKKKKKTDLTNNDRNYEKKKLNKGKFDYGKNNLFDVIQIWNTETGKTTGSIKVEQNEVCITFDRDGNVLYFIDATIAKVNVLKFYTSFYSIIIIDSKKIYHAVTGKVLSTETLNNFEVPKTERKIIEALPSPDNRVFFIIFDFIYMY